MGRVEGRLDMVGSDGGGLGACGRVTESCAVLAVEPAFTGMEATVYVFPLSVKLQHWLQNRNGRAKRQDVTQTHAVLGERMNGA